MHLLSATDYVKDLVSRGGPTRDEYEELEAWFRRAMAEHREGSLTPHDLHRLWDAFGEAFSPETMQGFACRAPHGYHGDYEIIDRIYDHWISPVPYLENWDAFFQSQVAPRAVRNRVAIFDRLLSERTSESPSATVRVLSVGSGPAREVRDYLRAHGDTRVRFVCLDLDRESVDYARERCRPFRKQVSFHVGNVFRDLPEGPFDVVWASGLFDYFNDRLFRVLAKKLVRLLVADGELVIGNFAVGNPTRDYMEFGEWTLVHRTAEDLLRLGVETGQAPEDLSVEAEPEGVNLFLHIRRH